MRRSLIVGNWKMHMDRAGAIALAKGIAQRATEFEYADLAVCPPAIYLETVAAAIADSRVALGAQNMHHESKGAYTGEISPLMLRDVSCQYVILGHSERRHIFGETDAVVNKKVLAALAAGLTPIACVGELLEQRQAGQTEKVIRQQFEGSLAGLTAEQMTQTVIAYEPVWAIGTGQVATPEQAEEVHLDLRKIVADRYNGPTADRIRILYGGSVKPDNAGQLLAQPDIDGALVGGACLKADDFLAIIAASKK